MTFDELIAQGIRDILEEKCAEYRLPGEKHRFSVAYKIKRAYMICFCVKKAPPSIRTVRFILIAVISVVFALAGFGLFKGLLKERSE